MKTEGETIILRRVKAFRKVLQEMSIYIQEDELLVGNLASKPRAAPVFPEFGVEWIADELSQFSRRSHDRFLISEDKKEELRNICRYWKGRTHFARCSKLLSLILPGALRGPGLKGYLHPNINEVFWITPHIFSGEGHIIPNYEKALDKGLNGIIEETERKLKELDYNDPESVKKIVFLDAVIISLRTVVEFAHRFSLLATNLGKKESDAERKAELRDIARICKWVPANPPRSFYEALQMCWFLHLVIQIESNGHSISLGRMDQYLYPFYYTDIQEGKITPEKARELIECFFVKCSESSKLRDWASTQALSGYPLFQALTIGGQTKTGEDAVNDLSYLFLRATGNTKLFIPSVMVRIHSKTSQGFLAAVCRTLIRHGGGLPAFFNDEIAIPMLCSIGVNLEDARNWAVMGCCEARVPGKYCTSQTPCIINLLKVLELSLNKGMNPNTGLQLCPGSRDLSSFSSYEEILSEFKRQLEFYVSFLPLCERIIRSSYAELTPTPFLSALIDYRTQVAKDVSEGGGPNYNDTVVHGHGIPDVGNSLAAIKRLVFEEKKLSGLQLKQALDTNFKSERGKGILVMAKKAPKYGNDDDYVDSIVAEIFRIFAKEVRKYNPLGGGNFGPTSQTLSMNVIDGEVVGATPDGRKAGESIADNISPAAGTDRKGPTAVYKSVSKLDHALMSDGIILNLKFHPIAVESEAGIEKFAQAIRTYFIDLKGFEVQFNIVSAETLENAQKNPERYQNLIVKVAGYSARFVDLEELWQNQLIARMEYANIP